MFSPASILQTPNVNLQVIFMSLLLSFKAKVRPFFFFTKCVKCFAILPCSTKTAPPRPQGFSDAVHFSGIYAVLSTSFSIYRKFGQRYLVMKNEPRHLSQSENKKYFEWIINEFMVLHMKLLVADVAKVGWWVAHQPDDKRFERKSLNPSNEKREKRRKIHLANQWSPMKFP